MWARRAAKLLALFGLYSLILAAIGSRLTSGGKNGGFEVGMIELGVVTVIFAAVALFIFTRPARAPLE